MVSKISSLSLFCAISMHISVVYGLSTNLADLRFIYYASPGNAKEIVHGDVASLTASGLKANADTLIIVDGFLSDSTSPMSQGSKNGFIGKSGGSNVIVLDWGKLSGSGTTLENTLQTSILYSNVLKNVGPVGQRIADFLNFLKVNKNIAFSQVHMVGHSLGAHISGAAGYYVQASYQGNLQRITGLDPAGPMFSSQPDEKLRLHHGDATFVDIYHTNRGTLGDSALQTGHINVFVNGGAAQPGCEDSDGSGFAGYCSHSFSWQLYNSAFDHSYYACPCSGVACQCKDCSVTCDNPLILGYRTPSSAIKGAYYIKTALL